MTLHLGVWDEGVTLHEECRCPRVRPLRSQEISGKAEHRRAQLEVDKLK